MASMATVRRRRRRRKTLPFRQRTCRWPLWRSTTRRRAAPPRMLGWRQAAPGMLAPALKCP
eukprot:2286355-Prymnesium_polylepis.1